MKTKSIILKLSLIIVATISQLSYANAQAGDTIIVQTFQFEGYPVLPGWNSPREGFFDFSAIEGKTFNKVLMYYTLKCDPKNNPKCGEWDYLSYTKVMEHTGKGKMSNFNIGGKSGYTPDSLQYMTSTSWDYESRIEKTPNYENEDNLQTFAVGTGTEIINNVFGSTSSDARNMMLVTKQELEAAGLTQGNITGLQFDFETANGETLKNLNIRMKQTDAEELTANVDVSGFSTVYAKDTKIEQQGWTSFNFSKVFNWDGNSNIIIDIFYSNESENNTYAVKGQAYDKNVMTSSSENDYFFNFNGPDVIPLSKSKIKDIQDEITISLWQYGDSKIQPQNDYLFEAQTKNAKRSLNVHLPWDDEKVYWDAGGDDEGYDRIEMKISAKDYEGQWNHWAFVKNATQGIMRIYLNGELLKIGTKKRRKIEIDSMIIGRTLTSMNPGFYDGAIDEFRIWDKELDQATIKEYMYKEVTPSHPNYANLKAYYKFDEKSGYTTHDEISNFDSNLLGIPQRKSYRGKRFKNFTAEAKRPNIKFNRNSANFNITKKLVVDSFPKGQIMIEKYVQNSPEEKPVLDETIYGYPTYYKYTYNEEGKVTDSTLVPFEQMLKKEIFTFNTNDPQEEILEPWEIGRFITPYGFGLDLGDGWTWVYDVTDFQHLLKGDKVHIRAGNFSELLDLKFAFIEGTPPRNLVDIKKVYSGDYKLDTFDEIVVPKKMPLNSAAEMYSVKTTVTGHGFGQGNNCGEFCPNIHSLEVNSTKVKSWDILIECADNPLYPQGGSWFYERAGWCPGMPAVTQNIDITSFVYPSDNEVEIDYNIQHDPDGNYVTEIFLVEYGAYNFANNASLEDIISPSNDNLNKRFNPLCGKPKIKIKNTGSEPLTSLHIDYGIYNQENKSFDWTGNLNFNEEVVVELPTLGYTNYLNNSNKFYAEISKPNGKADEYEHDNFKSVDFKVLPSYPGKITFKIFTNGRAYENKYEILDNDGNKVFENDLPKSNTWYSDTLNFQKGCYDFVIYDTAGDGMNNWPSNSGNGILNIYNPTTGKKIKTLERWFGKSLHHSFAIEQSSAVGSIESNGDFKVWPNPSTDGKLYFRVDNFKAQDFTVDVYNITGKVVLSQDYKMANKSAYTLNTSNLPKGMYIVTIKAAEQMYHQKIIVQ